jgi:hypothetical protein
VSALRRTLDPSMGLYQPVRDRALARVLEGSLRLVVLDRPGGVVVRGLVVALALGFAASCCPALLPGESRTMSLSGWGFEAAVTRKLEGMAPEQIEALLLRGMTTPSCEHAPPPEKGEQ